jgi:quercetin dioxygenase-like cupin family protein
VEESISMTQTIIKVSEVEHRDVNVPGASLQVVQTEAKGGMTGLAHFAPGTLVPEHWHTHADEMLYVISGDFVVEGIAYGPGTFFFVTAGTKHGPHSSVEGCTMLTCFSAALDFQTGDPTDFD